MTDAGQPPPGGWPPIRPDTAGTSPGQDLPPATPIAPSAVQHPSEISEQTYRGVASPRGPRFSGRAILGGLGLLTLLVTIAIMAVLATKVLTSTTDGQDDSDELVREALSPSTGLGATSSSTVDAQGQEIVGVTEASAAKRATDRDTLATAAEAFEAMNGSPPPDQQALVDSGILRAPISSQEFTSGPDGVVITGVGECAG